MQAIEKVNWDAVDYDKIIGDYLPMPDGSQHYIEMDMLHWYTLDFMSKQRPDAPAKLVKDTLKLLVDAPDVEEGEFDDLLKIGIMAWGREWIRQTEGR
jgi:hypothetical protein